MRVMCIRRTDWEIGHGPNFGDVDETVRKLFRWEQMYYELDRFRGTAFLASEFIPLSDEPAELIDESIEEPEMVTA